MKHITRVVFTKLILKVTKITKSQIQMANTFRQQAMERANKLFQKNFEMIIDQFYWFDMVIDEETHLRMVWVAKLSAVHSVELQLELCDPLADTYWQSVIREIYNITIPYNPNNINKNEN